MKILVLGSLILLAVSSNANAAAMTAERAQVMKQADVWSRPAWMAADGSISSTFNIKAAPQIAETQGLLESDTVECLMTEKYATQDRGTGLSPKFNCATDRWQKIYCSRILNGAAVQDYWGDVVCQGGCAPGVPAAKASANSCDKLQN